MTSVTFSKFVKSPHLRQAVKAGKSFLVTQYGKPCFRVLPPENAAMTEGAARHLFKGQAVSPEHIPNTEWNGSAKLALEPFPIKSLPMR